MTRWKILQGHTMKLHTNIPKPISLPSINLDTFTRYGASRTFLASLFAGSQKRMPWVKTIPAHPFKGCGLNMIIIWNEFAELCTILTYPERWQINLIEV